jgi:glycerophosphoryl diester phosphodiesterase
MSFTGGGPEGQGGGNKTAGRVEVHGHRGARGLRPENTLPGFAHALEIGVDAVELDVGLTADGAVVCNHDQRLSPVNCADTAPVDPGDPLFPYVGRSLRELTLDQVKTVDAGERRRSDPLAATQVAVPGARLPTLSEACDLVGRYEDARLAVEFKTGPDWPDSDVEWFVATVAEILETHGFGGRFRLLGFDWRVIVAARLMLPEIDCVALAESATVAPGTRWLAGLDPGDLTAAARAAGATVLSPSDRLTTPELIEKAHGLGLQVVPWTLNEPTAMARCIDWGIDGFVTDYPDRARGVLESYDLPLPQPCAASV